MDVWLTQTDGRHAALADAMRLGADGLLSEDGLHRTAVAGVTVDTVYPRSAGEGTAVGPVSAVPPVDTAGETADHEMTGNEPILTADELRALLAEQPIMPPSEEES